MTTIEEKRKELKDKSNSMDCVLYDSYFNVGKLEGFDLGVEMARKEFVRDMILLLIEHFVRSPISPNKFDNITTPSMFCEDIYGYLRTLEEKGK